MDIKRKAIFFEPSVEIEYEETEVCLYTSTNGWEGDIWEEFDDTNW